MRVFSPQVVAVSPLLPACRTLNRSNVDIQHDGEQEQKYAKTFCYFFAKFTSHSRFDYNFKDFHALLELTQTVGTAQGTDRRKAVTVAKAFLSKDLSAVLSINTHGMADRFNQFQNSHRFLQANQNTLGKKATSVTPRPYAISENSSTSKFENQSNLVLQKSIFMPSTILI
jgi:hypothetical protein